MRIKKHILPLTVIAGMILFMAIVNYLWLALNQQPPVDDEAIHLLSAIKYSNILQAPSHDIVSRLLDVDDLYPPLFPFVAALIAFVMDSTSTLLFCMTNILFVAITYISLYFMGLRTGNKWSGVLAAAILTMFPMYFHLSRMFMIETALVSMVTLCIALLMYSRYFQRRGVCVLAGMIFGLGLLTKQTFPFFIAGPAAFLFIKKFSGFHLKEQGRIINLFLFLGLGALIALPWYVHDFYVKFTGALVSVTDASQVPYQDFVFSWLSLKYYLDVLVRTQIFAFWSIVLASALTLLFIFKKVGRMCLFVIWIGGAYLTLVLFPNKFYYYTLPYLPAVAFLIAWGFWAINPYALRRVCVAFIIIVGMQQFVAWSFFFPEMHCAVLQGAHFTPQIYDPQAKILIDRIEQEAREKNITIGLRHIDGNIAIRTKTSPGEAGILLNKHMLQYIFELKGYLCEIVDLNAQTRRTDGRLPEFIISRGSFNRIAGASLPKDRYALIDVFALPDLSGVYLYKLNRSGSASARVNIHKLSGDSNIDAGEFNQKMMSRLMDLISLKNSDRPGNIL
ncbi:MAG: glycosyltransferase family 39 protein [Candidatus Omnitrophica bacterium]|nr:glycosyltransferase family 39 protein [Candidatus Omnitrophota bacterium]